MDIFDFLNEKNKEEESPLAARMRPKTLDEVVGQEHIIGKDKLLYRAIKADKISSIIFYGPAGTGKTTLARVIAGTTSSGFVQLNATIAGKAEMAEVVENAKNKRIVEGKKTILFVDEIHRFNKAQQDYLLPHVEDGTLVLIGATTENPYFEVNSALISRSSIFELKPLSPQNIKELVIRAVTDEQRGMGAYNASIDDEAAQFLADAVVGDARTALNAVELAVLTTDPDKDGVIHITTAVIEDCIQKKNIRYDKAGDGHYDTISAFIKSMRGSDPDAAVYYLARMLEAGESVTFIGRRIVICAAEDVGMADPNALVVAVNAMNAVHQIGMPEARIPLAEAAIYVATAPKSNRAYDAITKAMDAARTVSIKQIPTHLQDAHYKGAQKLGHGEGYLYAHNYENHYVKQQYLPDELVGTRFYEPTDIGYEHTINQYFKKIGKEA